MFVFAPLWFFFFNRGSAMLFCNCVFLIVLFRMDGDQVDNEQAAVQQEVGVFLSLSICLYQRALSLSLFRHPPPTRVLEHTSHGRQFNTLHRSLHSVK